MRQLFEALAHMHAKEFLHRDIKIGRCSCSCWQGGCEIAVARLCKRDIPFVPPTPPHPAVPRCFAENLVLWGREERCCLVDMASTARMLSVGEAKEQREREAAAAAAAEGGAYWLRSRAGGGAGPSTTRDAGHLSSLWVDAVSTPRCTPGQTAGDMQCGMQGTHLACRLPGSGGQGGGAASLNPGPSCLHPRRRICVETVNQNFQTDMYNPPEVVKGRGNTPASDVFSAALTAEGMLMGSLPLALAPAANATQARTATLALPTQLQARPSSCDLEPACEGGAACRHVGGRGRLARRATTLPRQPDLGLALPPSVLLADRAC